MRRPHPLTTAVVVVAAAMVVTGCCTTPAAPLARPRFSHPAPLQHAAVQDAAPNAVQPVAFETEAPRPGSLDDLVARALAQAPELVGAGARVDAAGHRADQAARRLNPTIGWTSEDMGVAGDQGNVHGPFVTQTIRTGGKRALAAATARGEADVTAREAESSRRELVTAVRRAYFDYAHAHSLDQVERDVEARAAERVATARTLVEKGEAGQAVLKQAELRLAQARATSTAARRQAASALQQLAARVGDASLLRSPPDASAARTPPIWKEDEVANRALAAAAPLATAAAQVALAEQRRQEAEVAGKPDLTFTLRPAHSFESDDSYMEKVEIGIPLPLFDRQQDRLAASTADLRAARAEQESRRLALAREVARDWQDYASARDRATSLASEILPAAREAVRLARLALEGGEGDYLTWTLAQDELTAVLREQANVEHSLWNAASLIAGHLGLDSFP